MHAFFGQDLHLGLGFLRFLFLNLIFGGEIIFSFENF